MVVTRKDFTPLFCAYDSLLPLLLLLHSWIGARSAARQGGKIVISHPKGAANVDKQRRANPMLVPNRLPTERVRG